MKNIKLIIEYDGTNYHGWQTQKNAKTVQDVIERAIEGLTGEKAALISSSRTDFGVHALGQVANFISNSTIPGDRFSYALNRILPEDIVIRSRVKLVWTFMRGFRQRVKIQVYYIQPQIPSAMLRNRAYHVSYNLDIDGMKKAALCFLGTHDFSSFKASGSSVKTSVRTITSVSLEKNDDVLKFEICGNGFYTTWCELL